MERLNNRLIAFLDVLGFSKMLLDNSLDDIYNSYSHFINEAKNKTFFQKPNDQLKRENFYAGKFISLYYWYLMILLIFIMLITF